MSPEDESFVETACCSSIIIKSHRNEGSSRSKRKHHIRQDTIRLNTKLSRPNDKKFDLEQAQNQGEACCFGQLSSIPEERFSRQVPQKEELGDVNNRDAPRQQPLSFDANDIPMPPSSEIKPGSEISVSEIQKDLKDLYDYNLMLREELIRAQSMLHTLTSKAGASNQQ